MKRTYAIIAAALFLAAASAFAQRAPKYISPNNDGVQDSLDVPLRISDRRYVVSWSFVVENESGSVVRTIGNKLAFTEKLTFRSFWKQLFSAKKTIDIPSVVSWNGVMDNGETAPDGTYNYYFTATDDNGNVGLAIHPLRKEPQLDFPYMGYKFSPEEKEQLLTTGNLGKTIEVTPKTGEPFSAYVSIDPQTNEIIALRADRVNIPKEIKGVTLSDVQYKDLVEGKAVKVEGMTAKSGKTFNATLQVNAERKGIEFIFDNNRGFKERQQQTQQQGIPHKLCGLELSEKQREALDSGRTLYLKNMVDKQGQPFNAYVRMDKEQNRPRFYKWNPDKKQETGKEKVVAVAEEHKTQVAVNNHGKTNEATKNVKEPLKTGQIQPTAAQKQKQDENKQKKSRGRKM